MQYAAQNLIPSTVELGGKSPNIFFADVMAHDDDFLDKAIEGLVLYAFNKGEVCTCPSRALVQADIYDEFMARCLERIAAIKQGNPLDTDTQLGPQVSRPAAGKDRVVRRHRPRRGRRGAHRRLSARASTASSPTATTSSRPCSRATTRCGSSRRRSSARCSRSPPSPTRPTRWPSPTTRSTASAPECGRATATAPTGWAAAIKAGRVWTNCYHQYPAGAAFGGYKISGVGRENHRMMLDHYSQTKNLLVSYSTKPLGLF